MMVRVQWYELTVEDKEGIKKYVSGITSEDYEAMIEKLKNHDLAMFRFTRNESNVRFVLEIREGASRELFIWVLFGKGLFRNIAEIAELIEQYAKHYECKRVTGLHQYEKNGLAKLYTMLGAKPVLIQYTKEL
jgi:hypothetical protein